MMQLKSSRSEPTPSLHPPYLFRLRVERHDDAKRPIGSLVAHDVELRDRAIGKADGAVPDLREGGGNRERG